MKNKNKRDIISRFLKETCEKQKKNNEKLGCTTEYISNKLGIQRTYVSAILNEMCKNNEITKIKQKPVIYISKSDNESYVSSKKIIGSNKSMARCIQQGKAAILYPPRGLNTLLLGATGVGKTMFAEYMYQFAIENGVLKSDAPFISFNCADFASNSQLLLAQLFGYKKGSFTGANIDKEGLVKEADGGILFLDEIHRLPPEGQEMLFYLIDKGEYKPLGSVSVSKKVNVLIICATTEKVENVLLPTLLRRIPMVISIPSLRERTLEERFELINEFFKVEANRINREIVSVPLIVQSLLLYNCTGNIGQLKSDIQLGCANGFLRCISTGKEKLDLSLNDFGSNVKKGILNYKYNKDSIDKIINKYSKYVYSPKGVEFIREKTNKKIDISIYAQIEKRVEELKRRGVNEKDIEMIMSIDIDNYFNKYIYKVSNDINKEEILKVVSREIVDLVDKFLKLASMELGKLYPQKVFYGLALHIAAFFERLSKGKSITNFKLQEIIDEYPKEYAIALRFANIIEEKKNIQIPIDEVGFLTMFICDDILGTKENSSKPVVLIAMHGNYTATSMCEVVNKLVGAENTFAYDMPLNKSSEVAYKELKDLIVQINEGGGVLLLVDMGSLGMFAELISEETGIKIKLIDMVTTVTALECSRKAMVEKDIELIYQDVNESLNKARYYENHDFKNNQDVIITMCMTGEGSAVKLKKMIEDNIDNDAIDIIPVSIVDKSDMNYKIKKISKDRNILCIAGTINPEVYGIPFISVSDLFSKGGYSKLDSILKCIKNESNNKISNADEIVRNLLDNLKDSIKEYDIEVYKEVYLSFIYKLQEDLGTDIDAETRVSLAFHIACVIEKIKLGEATRKPKLWESIAEKYSYEVEIINRHLKMIEENFNIVFTTDQVCYIIIALKKSKV